MTTEGTVYKAHGHRVVVRQAETYVKVTVINDEGWHRWNATGTSERQVRREIRKAIRWVEKHEAEQAAAKAIVERVLDR